MKKLKNLARRHVKSILAVAVLGVAALAPSKAHAQTSQGIVDLTQAGTQGATNVSSGGSAALPVFGAMVAIGCVAAGFRRLA